ncbi:unnamed protein product [Closterium sp. NIES-53]
MAGSGGTHSPRQVSPVRDLSGVGELVTPRVCQAAEAVLGGVQAPTLLTSAVSGTENVGAGASTSTALTPTQRTTHEAAEGRGSQDCAAAAGADHHRSHSFVQLRDQLHHCLCRLRHLRRLRRRHRRHRLHCCCRHLHHHHHPHHHPHSLHCLHHHLHRPGHPNEHPCPPCSCQCGGSR